MSNLRKISPYIILTVLVLSLASPTLPILLAQPVSIVSVTSPAYPGEAVAVTFDVGLATTVTVRLCNDAECTNTWASQVYVPPTAGRYTIVLTLPEKLPGLVNWNATCRYGWARVDTVFGGVAQAFCVAPKIKVSPPSTTVVDHKGTPQSAIVEFLAYAPGDTVDQVKLEGPASYTVTVSVSIAEDGYGNTMVNLLTITGQGIPRGIYKVYGVGTTTADLRKAKNGTLEVRPQVIIEPVEGHGRCDRTLCELNKANITGYGFAPKVAIVKVELWNINFTNVRYVFTPPTGFGTDENGYFELRNLTKYIAGGRGTNMTAGLYIPIVYEAPLPQVLTNTSTIDLGKVGSVVISEAAVVAKLGTRASVTATSFVDGTLDYIVKASTMAYVLTEVLRINITYVGKKYQLAANVEDLAAKIVRFALYNTTELPWRAMINVTTTATYNATLNAYVAHISFNIVPTGYTLTTPLAPGVYKYWASFYIYPNQILLVLREWSFIVTKANLTITYVNKDTGTTVKKFYVFPKNMSLVDTVLTIPTLKFTDAGIEWSIDWEYNATTKVAKLTVTGKPLVGPSFEFRNVYYIVRPLLVLLTPMPVLPGQKVSMAAYGYAPGAFWRHIPPGYDDNYIDVYWEKIVKLGVFRLGKDGNTTFVVAIPEDATFGVHYIWGVDKWGYEYTFAIIIGARAFYTVVPVPPYAVPKEPIVSAGYDNKRVMVCPCPETIVGLSYCAKCVKYVGVCDYLGDEIKVVISGISIGERITVYFGGRPIKTVIANASTVEITFIVPTVPEGDYALTAVGTISGTIYITEYFNGTKFIPRPVMVRPKVLLVDLSKDILPVLVGPGLVRVMGTGFRPGTSFVGMLINSTDAAFMLNMQVQRWGADERGVLINTYSKDIVPGLFIPALEPGAYEVKLIYIVGGETKITLPGLVFVINNLSVVATKFDISAVLSRLDKVMESVEKAREAASRAESAIVALRPVLDSKFAEIKTALDKVATKDDVDALLKAVGDVKTLLDSVSKAVADLKAVVATKDDVKALADVVKKLDTISANVDSAIGKLDNLLKALDAAQKAIQASVEDVKKAVDAVKTAIPVDAITEVRASVATAIDELAKARNEIAALRADVTGLRTDVASTRSDVGAVKSAVDAVKSDTAKLAGIEARVASVEDSVSMVRTLVIIALVFAVIAAAAAIYATIAISRALAK